ncbi:MAG TPA: trypsin-like peptidase domain-containing protein [Planctomycetota bacterium]|nr:trypsin-like peptidase domain-containing protein [Planctomycetota bacterium]
MHRMLAFGHRAAALICLALCTMLAPAHAIEGVPGADSTAMILPAPVDVGTLQMADQINQQRKAIIEKVSKAYIFIGGGSGVVISADGYIVTNDHVAGAQRNWRVRMVDGHTYKAHVTGTDPVSDLTMLKMDDPPPNLPWLKLGDSDRLEVGQTVIAVGNPFLLGSLDDVPTVTFGIVSSLHRFQGTYSDAIMTDVALNPGNSGGPLITLAGEVVGINGRIASRFGVRANSGIGYAIPSNQILAFMDDFKNAGGFYVFRSQIEGLQASNQIALTGREFIIGRIEPGSPADKAGFQANDVITHINGHKLNVANRYFGELGNLPPGKQITVTVQRGGGSKPAIKTLTVQLTKRLIEEAAPEGAVRKTVGLTLPPPAAEGATVEEKLAAMTIKGIKKGLAAEQVGLLVGDVLKDLNGQALTTQDDWIREYSKLKIGNKYPLTVLREGKPVKINLIPDLLRTASP